MNYPPHSSTDPETLARYSHDMVYSGHPDFVHLVSDLQQTREVLEYCHDHKLPVTFCGSQTSMTGASVADRGLVIALQNQNHILDIGIDPNTDEPFVVTEPGVILGDLKRAVAHAGFFYPPDPTSLNEAQIGATVATNATGEETFAFGPTRSYVNELEILKSDGTRALITRQNPAPPKPVKGLAGYLLDAEPIDELIGSEGTLALFTKIKLKLLRNDKSCRFVVILPFTHFKNCLEAVVKISNHSHKPRALELIGPGAGPYFCDCEHCPTELKKFGFFLYIRDDYETEAECEKKLSGWFDFLSKMYSALGETKQMEQIVVAQTQRQLEDIRRCRHHIPLKVNEDFFPCTQQGGGKIGTDWWVPTQHIPQMMLETHAEAQKLGIPFLVFGHIGNGHPHWNFLTKNPEEKKLAFDFVKRQCAQAVKLGGGIAGEHGIGKIKRDLLPIQHDAQTIQKMRELKQKWDPNWILGQGNIFKAK